MKNPPGTSQNWHINGTNVGVFTHWVGITLILHVLQWSQYTERNGERGKNSILFVIKQKTSVSAITASVQNWTKSYDTTYMWNLKKKKYKLTFLQNRKRVTDVENKLMVSKEGKRWGGRINWEVGTDICTLLLIYKKITNSMDMK